MRSSVVLCQYLTQNKIIEILCSHYPRERLSWNSWADCFSACC